jgi:hypothetical protein
MFWYGMLAGIILVCVIGGIWVCRAVCDIVNSCK